MRDYSNLTVEDLFNLYVIHDEEREAVDTFVLALPEPKKELFLSLKSTNAGALGLELSPFNGVQDIKVFRIDVQGTSVKFITYNPFSFKSFRAYIDRVIEVKIEDPELLKCIIKAELKKCKKRLKTIKRERLELYSISNFEANIARKRQVNECLTYLQQLYGPAIEPKVDIKENQPISGLQDEPPSMYELLIQNRQSSAKGYLRHLSGFNQKGKPIVEAKDYERLLSYTDYLVRFEKVPEKIEPIHKVGVYQKHIKYTYYVIYTELYSKGPQRQIFINFLYAVFPALFEGTKR